MALVPVKAGSLAEITPVSGQLTPVNYMKNVAFGGETFMNIFLNQNPDLKQDQMFFWFAQYAGVLIPMAGLASKLVTMMTVDLARTPFKMAYMRLINKDKQLLGLMKQMGISTKALNVGSLREVSKLAIAQNNANKQALMPSNMGRMYTDILQKAKNDSDRRRLKTMLFVDMFVKTTSLIVVIMKLFSYMFYVASDIKMETAVTADNLDKIINLLARYLYVMRAAAPILGMASVARVTAYLKSKTGINLRGGFGNTGFETLSGIMTAAGSKFLVTPALVTALYYNVGQLLSTYDNIIRPTNRSFVNSIFASLDVGIRDGLFDAFQTGFRGTRNFLNGTSFVLQGIMVAGGIEIARQTIKSTLTTLRKGQNRIIGKNNRAIRQ
jgi:hypothetical protein